jgi:hypothetical protein
MLLFGQRVKKPVVGAGAFDSPSEKVAKYA